ncbi:MAG: primase-like DNA-binding domain-containing protein [Fluviibacter sp.]
MSSKPTQLELEVAYYNDINESTKSKYADNKYFQLLLIIPSQILRKDTNDIFQVMFAIVNMASSDIDSTNKLTQAEVITQKKNIFRYIASQAFNDWSHTKERNYMQFIDEPSLCKKAKTIKNSTMARIKSMCKQHAKKEFAVWERKAKSQWQAGYIRDVRAAASKQAFLLSPLYKFIQGFTEADHTKISSKDLFDRYKTFCDDNEYVHDTKCAMSKVLTKHGIEAFRSSSKRGFEFTQDNITKFINYYGEPVIEPVSKPVIEPVIESSDTESICSEESTQVIECDSADCEPDSDSDDEDEPVVATKSSHQYDSDDDNASDYEEDYSDSEDEDYERRMTESNRKMRIREINTKLQTLTNYMSTADDEIKEIEANISKHSKNLNDCDEDRKDILRDHIARIYSKLSERQEMRRSNREHIAELQEELKSLM